MEQTILAKAKNLIHDSSPETTARLEQILADEGFLEKIELGSIPGRSFRSRNLLSSGQPDYLSPYEQGFTVLKQTGDGKVYIAARGIITPEQAGRIGLGNSRAAFFYLRDEQQTALKDADLLNYFINVARNWEMLARMQHERHKDNLELGTNPVMRFGRRTIRTFKIIFAGTRPHSHEEEMLFKTDPYDAFNLSIVSNSYGEAGLRRYALMEEARKVRKKD